MQKVVNRQALHNYHILDSFEAGIVLNGGEVKSIKLGRVDLAGSHIRILGNQAYLINANIPPYQNHQLKDYQPTRSRKLLLHRSQINSLIGKSAVAGVTLIPASIYEKNNLLKVQVGLGRSKKLYDKRRILKEKDQIRRVEQELRGEKLEYQVEKRK